jgi:hypothetical protein
MTPLEAQRLKVGDAVRWRMRDGTLSEDRGVVTETNANLIFVRWEDGRQISYSLRSQVGKLVVERGA